jgi:hypothetical protein
MTKYSREEKAERVEEWKRSGAWHQILDSAWLFFGDFTASYFGGVLDMDWDKIFLL